MVTEQQIFDSDWNPIVADWNKGTGTDEVIDIVASYVVTKEAISHEEPVTYYIRQEDGTVTEVDASTVSSEPDGTFGTDTKFVVDEPQEGHWSYFRSGELWEGCPDLHEDWWDEADVITVPFEYVKWHWFDEQEQAEHDEQEAKQEQEQQEAQDKQELLDAIPDAIAELSEQVSINSADGSDLTEAIAELSQLVSDLMEANNG